MQLDVKIERILCRKESGWCMLKTDKGIVKGMLKWAPAEGNLLILSGEHAAYQGEKHFQFKTAKISVPVNPLAQLKYVCERAKGIGPELTASIWEARGEDWRNLKRGEIKGMRDATYNYFKEQIKAFKADKEKAETISYLEGKGASTALASAAWEVWQANAVGIVNSNCYQLSALANFGFNDVDNKIRQNFGIGDEDPRRIRAATIYAIKQLVKNGSTVVNWFVHEARIRELLPEVAPLLITDSVMDMVKRGEIKAFPKYQVGALAGDYTAELCIYNFVKQSAEIPKNEKLEKKVTEWLDDYRDTITPDDGQKEAVSFAVLNSFAIINGGAGTGKTTIINLICKALGLFLPNKEIALCAFAGKAAARLKEATGKHASTIHSLLGSKGGDIFTRESLTDTIVIIDESSMVNGHLMAEITKRKPDALILVGDQAQLSPVGPGQPFHDLLEIFPEQLCTLKNCYRNTEAVFQAASRIRAGEMPLKTATSDKECWNIIASGDPANTEHVIIEWVKQGYLDFEKDIILCPQNGKKDKETELFTPATVNSLNEAIVEIVNPGDRSEDKFLPGDRVMNLKNEPSADVWNGTTGSVHSVDQEGKIYVKLDVPIIDHEATNDESKPVYKDIVLFDKKMVKALTHAYALTVHKSQGSQYSSVIMVCLSRDTFSLDRSLIYTGVTRTRENCTVIGDYRALQTGIDRTKKKETVIQLLALTEED